MTEAAKKVELLQTLLELHEGKKTAGTSYVCNQIATGNSNGGFRKTTTDDYKNKLLNKEEKKSIKNVSIILSMGYENYSDADAVVINDFIKRKNMLIRTIMDFYKT